MPPGELTSDDIETGPGGEPVADAAAVKATYRVGAKLIVGMRIYDPTAPIELDEQGNVLPGDMPLLPSRNVTPEDVAKLPMTVIEWLGEELAKVNPPQTPESPGATGNPS